jgi:hypothetical protein
MAVGGIPAVTEDLRAFLLAAPGRPFAWGTCDCALWVCEWIKQRRGVDPGARFRGAYQTARGCRRLLRREGGLLVLATHAFGQALLPIVKDMAAADVVCVDASFGETLGIAVSDRRVALKSDRGLIVSAAYPVLRAWRI